MLGAVSLACWCFTAACSSMCLLTIQTNGRATRSVHTGAAAQSLSRTVLACVDSRDQPSRLRPVTLVTMAEKSFPYKLCAVPPLHLLTAAKCACVLSLLLHGVHAEGHEVGL